MYVDLAVDENGLWAILAMAENNNTLVLKVEFLTSIILRNFANHTRKIAESISNAKTIVSEGY